MRVSRKNLFIIILIASLLFNLVFIGRKIHYHYFVKPKNTFSTKTAAGLYEEIFRSCPNDSSEIIFLGNSITAAFHIAELLPELKIKNRGISGNQTHDVLNRVSEISESFPGKIFIMLGVNDVCNGKIPKEILVSYHQILDSIFTRSPATSVYIQSILPVSKNVSYFFTGDHNEMNRIIDRINDSLELLAVQRKCTYISLNTLFKRDDALDPKYSWDGIHINAEGYQLWFEHIRKYLVKPGDY